MTDIQTKKLPGTVVEVLVYGKPDSVIEVKDPAFNSPLAEPTFERKAEELEVIGSGMGFAIDKGVILTSAHVLESGSRYHIKLKDGSEHTAKLIQKDESKDLAALRLSDELKIGFFDLSPSDPALKQVVTLGTQTGDILKKDQSLVAGTLNKPIKVEGLLQTSIPVQLGESGSPLLNGEGEVVGIATVTSNEDPAVSFAIPVSVIKEFLTETDGVK